MDKNINPLVNMLKISDIAKKRISVVLDLLSVMILPYGGLEDIKAGSTVLGSMFMVIGLIGAVELYKRLMKA